MRLGSIDLVRGLGTLVGGWFGLVKLARMVHQCPAWSRTDFDDVKGNSYRGGQAQAGSPLMKPCSSVMHFVEAEESPCSGLPDRAW